MVEQHHLPIDLEFPPVPPYGALQRAILVAAKLIALRPLLCPMLAIQHSRFQTAR